MDTILSSPVAIIALALCAILIIILLVQTKHVGQFLLRVLVVLQLAGVRRSRRVRLRRLRLRLRLRRPVLLLQYLPCLIFYFPLLMPVTGVPQIVVQAHILVPQARLLKIINTPSSSQRLQTVLPLVQLMLINMKPAMTG